MTPRATSTRLVLATAIFFAVALPLTGDDLAEYQIKAEFIERFTRFIDWPEGSQVERDPHVPFVIGIIGRDPFGPHLANIAKQRTIKGHAVEIRQLDSIADADKCHALFIAASEKPRLGQILAQTRDKPILTLGDTRGFGDGGVLINLFTEDNKVRFEINSAAVDRSGLKVSSKLYKLARVIGPNGK